MAPEVAGAEEGTCVPSAGQRVPSLVLALPGHGPVPPGCVFTHVTLVEGSSKIINPWQTPHLCPPWAPECLACVHLEPSSPGFLTLSAPPGPPLPNPGLPSSLRTMTAVTPLRRFTRGPSPPRATATILPGFPSSSSQGPATTASTRHYDVRSSMLSSRMFSLQVPSAPNVACR